MKNTSYFNDELEKQFPHADDVLERMEAENGFAAGWAMHQKPVPKYVFDNHIHYNGPKDLPVSQCIKASMNNWEIYKATRAMLIINIYGESSDCDIPEYAQSSDFPWFTVEDFKKRFDDLTDKTRIFRTAWIHHKEPNPDLIRAVAAAGFNGIKLHNAPIIETNAPYDLWLSDKWQETFKTMGECDLPVLIHVTQRLPCSEYVGGRRNAYWSVGWENGVTYGNEDLLQTFLKCCKLHPNIKFIGAHQLHIGWERLNELFAEYPNLYVDTTIGCTLKTYDDFYPHDKEYLRNIFIKHSDRILFGTDRFWGSNESMFDDTTFDQHLRFIYRLDLPADVLNNICHGNIERIYNIDPL